MTDSMEFPQNEFEAINTTGMRVIPYNTDTVDQLNPYHRYMNRCNRYIVQRHLQNLLTQGNIIKEGEKEETHPSLCNIALKEHQKRLVYEMKQLENSDFHYTNRQRIGFLCDAVGTGKSLSMLSLIMSNPRPTGGKTLRVPYMNPLKNSMNEPYLPNVVDIWNEDACYKELNSTLIVIPHSIFSQWKIYITNDTNMTTSFIYSKKSLSEFVGKVKSYIDNPSTAPNIVLCKSTYYNQLVTEIQNLGDEYINQQDIQDVKYDEDSVDYSIIQTHDMSTHIRSASRQIQALIYEYRRGASNIQDVAERMNDLRILLDTNNDHIQRIMDTEQHTPGCLVRRVYVPKSGVLWNRVVYDEADTIPISASLGVMSRMFWMVSASMQSFVLPYTSPPPHRTGFIRGLIEIQDKCNFYMQHCMFTSTSEAIQESFPLPEPTTQLIRCFTPNHIRIAQESNLRSVVDALNAGNTELALQLCNCDMESSEQGLIESLKQNMRQQIDQIVSKRTRVQRHERVTNEKIQEYQQELDNLGPRDEILSLDNRDRYNVLSETLRMYQNNLNGYQSRISSFDSQIESLQSRLRTMDRRLEDTMNQDCPICMEPIEDGKRAIVKCCNQTFCVECVMQQMAAYQHRTTPCPCPMCRAHLTPASFTVLKKDRQQDEERVQLPTKEQKLIQLLMDEQNKRILLFSGHDSTFQNIVPMMQAKNVKYELLNGSDSVIQKKVGRWKDGKIKVLCLNSKMLGAGLNLPQASDIIIYHEQEKELEEQIIGRAQRPGRNQDESLRIWKLAYSTEYNSNSN